MGDAERNKIAETQHARFVDLDMRMLIIELKDTGSLNKWPRHPVVK